MVQYHDLVALLIPAIIMQAIAIVYLLKIRKAIGRKMSALLGIIIETELEFVIIIFSILLLTPSAQPINPLGIYIAFIYPTRIAVFIMLVQRMLAKCYSSL